MRLPYSYSPSVQPYSGGEASQAIGRVAREPREGEIPWADARQPSVFAFFYFSIFKLIFKLLKGVTMQENKLPKGKENKASENSLEETTTYRIEGRSFVVKPVFKEGDANTFGAILLRLMQADCESNS